MNNSRTISVKHVSPEGTVSKVKTADGTTIRELQTGAIFTEYIKATELTGPDMYLLPYEAKLPGVGRVKLKSVGFSWTVESIRLNLKAYLEVFKKPAPNLNGQLADSNMANFQTEYIRIYRENPTLAPEQIANEAIRHVSFGEHRISAGYGEIKVTIEETIVVEIDGKLVKIPDWVEIEALPTVK